MKRPLSPVSSLDEQPRNPAEHKVAISQLLQTSVQHTGAAVHSRQIPEAFVMSEVQ
jgi:hypothetical protein